MQALRRPGIAGVWLLKGYPIRIREEPNYRNSLRTLRSSAQGDACTCVQEASADSQGSVWRRPGVRTPILHALQHCYNMHRPSGLDAQHRMSPMQHAWLAGMPCTHSSMVHWVLPMCPAIVIQLRASTSTQLFIDTTRQMADACPVPCFHGRGQVQLHPTMGISYTVAYAHHHTPTPPSY